MIEVLDCWFKSVYLPLSGMVPIRSAESESRRGISSASQGFLHLRPGERTPRRRRSQAHAPAGTSRLSSLPRSLPSSLPFSLEVAARSLVSATESRLVEERVDEAEDRPQKLRRG